MIASWKPSLKLFSLSFLADQCGSNIKMVQGLEPLLAESIFLYRSQPHLPSRQIFFEQSRKIVHPSSANWWRRKTRSIRWKTEEMHQSELGFGGLAGAGNGKHFGEMFVKHSIRLAKSFHSNVKCLLIMFCSESTNFH